MEAISYTVDDPGMDEGAPYIKSVKRTLSFSLNRIPEQDNLKFVERMKETLKKKGYEDLRIRWKEDKKSQTSVRQN